MFAQMCGFSYSVHSCNEFQSSNCPGTTRFFGPKPHKHLLGLTVNITHDSDLTISLPLALGIFALVDTDGVDPEGSAADPSTKRPQCLETIWSDIERI